MILKWFIKYVFSLDNYGKVFNKLRRTINVLNSCTIIRYIRYITFINEINYLIFFSERKNAQRQRLSAVNQPFSGTIFIFFYFVQNF